MPHHASPDQTRRQATVSPPRYAPFVGACLHVHSVWTRTNITTVLIRPSTSSRLGGGRQHQKTVRALIHKPLWSLWATCLSCFSGRFGPETPLDRRGSACSAGRTSHLKPGWPPISAGAKTWIFSSKRRYPNLDGWPLWHRGPSRLSKSMIRGSSGPYRLPKSMIRGPSGPSRPPKSVIRGPSGAPPINILLV